MDLDDSEPKCESSRSQNLKIEKIDFDEIESNIEEKPPVINPNETEMQNKCVEIKLEEIENSEEEENDKQNQKLLKSEELIIKFEEDDLDGPDDVDICSECTVIVAVNDNPVLMGTADRASQTLPKGTFILRSSDAHRLGIYSRRQLKKGVRLGPYEGHTIKIESTGGYSWKLMEGRLVDMSDETSSNYLRYVNYARDLSEQNLEAFQCKGELYYRTNRDIEKGEELLIYIDDNPDKTYYEPNEENLDVEFYKCQFCQLELQFEAHRDRHQMFCKIRTDKSSDGSLCRHFAISSDKGADEETQSVPAASTRPYDHDFCIYGTSQKLKHQQKNVHEIKHHMNNAFLCIDCDYKTFCKDDLNTHRLKHQPTKIFKCVCCDYETVHKRNLKEHRRQHDPTKMFKCASCDYKTVSKSRINIHRRRHDPTKMLKCDDCDYETYWKSNLSSHRKKHKLNKMLKCQYCEYQSFYECRLNIHKQKHELTNNFKCVDCDYETFNKYYLKKHRQTHEPTDYKTVHKSGLNTHRKKHDLTKILKCADCDYVTLHKRYLNQHRKQHEPTKMLKCVECDYETYWRSGLNTHRKKHKPNMN